MVPSLRQAVKLATRPGAATRGAGLLPPGRLPGADLVGQQAAVAGGRAGPGQVVRFGAGAASSGALASKARRVAPDGRCRARPQVDRRGLGGSADPREARAPGWPQPARHRRPDPAARDPGRRKRVREPGCRRPARRHPAAFRGTRGRHAESLRLPREPLQGPPVGPRGFGSASRSGLLARGGRGQAARARTGAARGVPGRTGCDRVAGAGVHPPGRYPWKQAFSVAAGSGAAGSSGGSRKCGRERRSRKSIIVAALASR